MAPIILIVAFVLLIGARTVAGVFIDYQWWNELGQVDTWLNLFVYGSAPQLVAGLAAAVCLWIGFARGMKFGGSRLMGHSTILRVSMLAALIGGLLVSAAIVDSWTIIRWVGSRSLAPTAWKDPVFGHPLSFYFFDLPFYEEIHGWVLTVAVLTAIVYWLSGRVGQLSLQLPEMRDTGEVDLRMLRLDGGLESAFLRIVGALVLVALAVRFFLARYGLLMSDHNFMTGIDYADEHIRMPLLWVMAAASLLSAAGVLAGQWRALGVLAAAGAAYAFIPAAVGALYVRPNEITLERPYIERHIRATRAAFGLDTRITEAEYKATAEKRINPAAHQPLLSNVRLWDWRAFHDTVTQIQALRPYYVFADSDVDRYMIDGSLRQVLLTPRELDIRQLPDAQRRWINPHFIYTHGYGTVMAEANRITADGLPHLFVQDAPAQVKTGSLKLTRPEIYYGEVTHEPVYVRTEQKEFSYPSGAESVFTRYEGSGGFPIAGFGARLAAGLREADFNILLTNQLSSDSRMMIRRRVSERLEELAGFINWDPDPYLVVTSEGTLVWTVDGYTTSNAHPYSAAVRLPWGDQANYIRNSIKATVDAYHGTVTLYINDEADPIIGAYRALLPQLFKPLSAMPESIRGHLRYPETFFSVQAGVYRLYHMRDPQAFYNKEDVWEVARNIYGRESRPQALPPSYVVATLPGEEKAEFLLMLPFTPRGKDNLIGMMVARCDGASLGELRFLHLSKQALVFGPMQIEARIDQDPEISKDLTLWSQKGSEVLRGQMLALPIDGTFLYVEPIYIQAAEARMPQLKKVVVAMGNELVYRNTYEEALQALVGSGTPLTAKATAESPAAAGATPAAAPAPAPDQRISELRTRLRRYRELWSQGKYAEAGRELEAIETLVQR